MKKMKSSLGQDMVEEILIRLPVKSLMRFKCIHPSWNALFRDPTFINMHLQHHHNHNHVEEERLMIFDNKIFNTSSRMKCYIRQRQLISDDHEESQHVESPFPHKVPSSRNEIIHPCPSYKGVFCLFKIHKRYFHNLPIESPFQVILWNPSTREVKVVPPPPSPSSHDIVNFNHLVCGFGGDPKTNDMKIVYFTFDIDIISDRDNWHRSPSAELYNLSTNTWTNLNIVVAVPIKALDLFETGITNGIVVDGVCHWLTGSLWNERKDANILCFDFRNNQFHRLELPVQINPGENHSLTEMNDSIAFVYHRNHHQPPSFWGTEIWTMDQDNCWTRKFNFDWLVPIYTFWGRDSAEFIGMPRAVSLESDFSFRRYRTYIEDLGDDLCLMSYSTNDGKPVRHFEFSLALTRTSFCYFHARKYVESIVSLSSFPN